MKIKISLIALILCLTIKSVAHARYYDPSNGRFISPDTVVQAPYDPQSLNRYAYVRNNPLNLTDPSGHSWFSSAISKAGHWVDQHREFSGLVWQTFDVFSGSAYLASFANGRAILMGQAITAGSFGVGGTAVGWGAVSGELSSAYIAYRTGGNMMTAVIRGGIEGAAISAVFSGISGTHVSWVQKALEKSAISAGLTAAQGGDAKGIEMSAGLTFAAEAANSYFIKTVGYQPDPTPGMAPSDGSYYYDPYESPEPVSGTNVWGVDEEPNNHFWHDTWIQGGPVSSAANLIPGQNALAELHDTWLNTNYFGSMPQAIQNFGSMPAAFVTSYAAEFSGPWAPAISLSFGR